MDSFMVTRLIPNIVESGLPLGLGVVSHLLLDALFAALILACGLEALSQRPGMVHSVLVEKLMIFSLLSASRDLARGLEIILNRPGVYVHGVV